MKRRKRTLAKNHRERWNLFFITILTVSIFVTLFALSQRQVLRQNAAATAFRFVSWADTKAGTDVLATESQQAKALNPAFTIYEGDNVDAGFDAAAMSTWKQALDGNASNGMSAITFSVRGNHDSSNAAGWQSFFNFSSVASKVGATNYTALDANLTYAFDYNNSIFIGIDAPGDLSGDISTVQVTWLDQQLTGAESRGLVHAFLYWHGPLYYVDEHQASVETNVVTVLNKHPIVSAIFVGHEHVLAYVHMGTNRISNIAHPFEQFTNGTAGAEHYNCASGRSDWCASSDGFTVVDVNGNSFTVSIYQAGSTSPLKTVTITKASTTPSQTGSPAPTSSTSTVPTTALSSNPTPGTSSPTTAATATPPYVTPTWVCGGSSNGVCATNTPTLPVTQAVSSPTPPATSTVTPVPTAQPTPTPTVNQITDTPAAAQPTNTPPVQNNNQNGSVSGLISQLLNLLLSLLQKILDLFKNIMKHK